MKLSLPLTLALLFQFTTLNGQQIFPTGASWAISHSTIAGPQPQGYQFLCGDTIFNDTLYQKLYRADDIANGPFVYLFAIRENGPQVWYRTETLGDALLYDFSLQENDVFPIPGSFPSLELVVEEVTFEMMNGVQRKKMKFKNVGSFPGETWWDGIGSNRGFGNRGTGYAPDNSFFICCAKTADNTNNYELPNPNDKCNCDYMPNLTACSTTNAVADLENDRISIRPNPTSDFIFLEYEKGGAMEIVIFDSMGKQLLSSKEAAFLNISHLPNGVYWLQFTDSKLGITGVKKIIKTAGD